MRRSTEFILSPSYFGTVTIKENVPTDHPDLIKSPLFDISSDELTPHISRKRLESKAGSVQEMRKILPIIELRRLNIIEPPSPLSRSVIHGKGNKVPPLFIGKGKIDFYCGQCSAFLGKYVWSPSISNIVIECPICRSYNEISPLPNCGFHKVKLTRGDYYFSNALRLKRGTCLEGS